MALRLGVDMKVFDAVAKRSKDGGELGGVRIEQLAEETGVDSLLLSRFHVTWLSVEGFKACWQPHTQLASWEFWPAW